MPTVQVFAGYGGDLHESADVVVVGSGPGGAVVAHELAQGGHDVILVEEGPPFTPEDFELDGALSMARTMREAGLRTTRGYIMPTMQAIALGGGSLVNSAICVRAPASALDAWCETHALASTTRADLDPHYEAVEKFLGIGPTPENVLGARNLLFRRACDTLGVSSEPIPRNVIGCRGSGECFTGCRARAKQSMDISYVPAAVRAGCRVRTSLQVQRLLIDGRRVRGVAGRVVRPFTGEPSHRFEIEARIVVLAAGVMATPVLLARSGNLANGSGQLGENLQFHPGVAVMGVFPEPTQPVFGATQGCQSLAFLDEGFKLETLWAPPALLAVRLPGFGHELKRRLAEIPNAAVWDAFASCHRSLGRVRPRPGRMDPDIQWRFHPDDVRILRRALWVLAELFFAAGARKILPGVNRLPEEMHSLDEARVLRDHDLRATDLVCGGNHVFGSTRMHGDPHRGVVGEDGRCYDLDNVYIVDTGIFPRSPGVNPMLTCMALAHRIAGHVAERL
ncbi:MAG: GMC family oxidoreductase N-terminal domain-containing protein [Myxococcota bacterium]